MKQNAEVQEDEAVVIGMHIKEIPFVLSDLYFRRFIAKLQLPIALKTLKFLFMFNFVSFNFVSISEFVGKTKKGYRVKSGRTRGFAPTQMGTGFTSRKKNNETHLIRSEIEWTFFNFFQGRIEPI